MRIPFARGCMEPEAVAKRLKNSTKAVHLGGFLPIIQTLRKVREDFEAQQTAVATVVAGDFLGPSFTAGIFKGDQLVQLMNLASVDAVNIGNHDMDFGTPKLLKTATLI